MAEKIAEDGRRELEKLSQELSDKLRDKFAGIDHQAKQRLDALEFDFVSRKFYPQSPPVEVLGPVDLPWRWSLQSE